MLPGHDDGDGLLNRAELEIELARLALVMARTRESASTKEPPGGAFVAWFEDKALDIVNRAAPDFRPLAVERLHQIAGIAPPHGSTQFDVRSAGRNFSFDAPRTTSAPTPPFEK